MFTIVLSEGTNFLKNWIFWDKITNANWVYYTIWKDVHVPISKFIIPLLQICWGEGEALRVPYQTNEIVGNRPKRVNKKFWFTERLKPTLREKYLVSEFFPLYFPASFTRKYDMQLCKYSVLCIPKMIIRSQVLKKCLSFLAKYFSISWETFFYFWENILYFSGNVFISR